MAKVLGRYWVLGTVMPDFTQVVLTLVEDRESRIIMVLYETPRAVAVPGFSQARLASWAAIAQ